MLYKTILLLPGSGSTSSHASQKKPNQGVMSILANDWVLLDQIEQELLSRTKIQTVTGSPMIVHWSHV
ncbi:MAG: hypothetical protein HS120_04320 [Burkholderiales bacterium]|nr:hypothetical protein [Burkholderiales bacterium]